MIIPSSTSSASRTLLQKLSRILSGTTASFFVLSTPNFTFLDDLRHSLADNHHFRKQCELVTASPDSHPDFKLHKGLLFFRGKIWLDPLNSFRTALIDEYHATPLGGHMGFAKTIHRVQQNFYWSSMRNDVKQFVRQCATCQQDKYIPKSPAGLL